MREYPLQYASTDKNKKSHYNFERHVRPLLTGNNLWKEALADC